MQDETNMMLFDMETTVGTAKATRVAARKMLEKQARCK